MITKEENVLNVGGRERNDEQLAKVLCVAG